MKKDEIFINVLFSFKIFAFFIINVKYLKVYLFFPAQICHFIIIFKNTKLNLINERDSFLFEIIFFIFMFLVLSWSCEYFMIISKGAAKKLLLQ